MKNTNYNMFNKLMVSLIVLISFTSCLAIDLNHTEIYTVTETTRFTALNPDVKLDPFQKVRHVKGNYVFTIGDRIAGKNTNTLWNIKDYYSFGTQNFPSYGRYLCYFGYEMEITR